MMVCAHGNVTDFCKDRDMVICATWEGDLRAYSGAIRVLVTDQDMSESEYYFLKGEFLAKGIELVSTHHKDDELLLGYLAYATECRKKKYGTRQSFGFQVKDGEVVLCPESLVVVRRILELRDAGSTLRSIREDEGVHRKDGRKLSISTIQKIIKEREKYE